MRLVRVKAPPGRGSDVMQVAFAAGIGQATLHQQQVHRAAGGAETKDVVDVECATPAAKQFLDALLAASFFDPHEYSVTVRQPRTVVAREGPVKLTRPLVEPTLDIFEELWQFSHVTFGFVGRVLIAAGLLAYGMIHHKLLLMVAGLLFLPLLPLLLAVSFGLWTRTWRLARQGIYAFAVATLLMVGAGAAVARLTDPPLQYQESSPLIVSLLISLAVGAAAGLATADDVGRREMIGLAATAQIALIPVWFGICLVFGFSASGTDTPGRRALTFLVNVGAIVVAALVVYLLLRMRGEAVRRFDAVTKARAS